MTFLNNKKYHIIWTTNFKYELKKIFNYLIYFLNLPLSAEKLHRKIVTSLSTLQYFPERHSKIREIKNFKYKNIHRLIIDNYIIIYKVNSDTGQVFILHIFHSSQDYLTLL